MNGRIYPHLYNESFIRPESIIGTCIARYQTISGVNYAMHEIANSIYSE
jgi:hypothetical protein